MNRQIITILGATGSIGESTLDVISRHPERFEVFALSAHRQIDKLAQLCLQYHPQIAVVGEAEDAHTLRNLLGQQGSQTEVLFGVDALCSIASHPNVTTVMAAIVGAAGLLPTLAAARHGKRILLANKEALVMAGPLFMQAVQENNAQLLPIDSEHNAIFQALPFGFTPGLSDCGVRRIILTASGGPFRTVSSTDFDAITPAQACAHPNWSMGRKISVDSATMMNKGLELIEAHHLFGVAPEHLEVLVHPQSIIHSMVEYKDGSTLAQLGNPDMRTPIAHALAYPHRIEAGVSLLDLAKIGKLEFEAPDFVRFPCLRLAYEALRVGGNIPTILNAANEIAVEAFLQGRIRFTQIAALIEDVLSGITEQNISDLDAVLAADLQGRSLANQFVKKLN